MPEPQDESPAQLPNHKVKYKKPLQRACNEKDEKGKFCGGHLKRWFYMADILERACGDVRQAFGDNGEVYRCEHCKTLYLPNADEPRGKNVAGVGKLSIFGVTVVPKTPATAGGAATRSSPRSELGFATLAGSVPSVGMEGCSVLWGAGIRTHENRS